MNNKEYYRVNPQGIKIDLTTEEIERIKEIESSLED